ncbi:glutamyl-tRNA reductase [bacterium]|nr:glutamyl-tRNA reductase [bacterium]
MTLHCETTTRVIRAYTGHLTSVHAHRSSVVTSDRFPYACADRSRPTSYRATANTMPIITVGLSHRTAPVDLRERVTIDESELPTALCQIHALPGIEEVLILSTCNRLEIYAVAQDFASARRSIEDFLCRRAANTDEPLRPHLYVLDGEASISHLMHVACGLDSLILGEPQILGQVNFAQSAAQQVGTLGMVLQRLVSGAIHAGKRARAETAISRYTTSTSHAAVLLAAHHVADLHNARVLVIGAGEMANLAIKALHREGVCYLGCINRTFSRAEALVTAYGGQAFNWYHLAEALLWADVVIAATGSPHTVIHKEEVAEIHAQRQGRPLVFVDIALPRDVEADVADFDGVFCYDIDDLRATLDANLAQREAARPDVEVVIAEEMSAFVQWHNSRRAIPTVVEMRRKVESIAQDELAEALALLPELSEREEEIVRRLVHRLVNKVLHEPTVQLKAAAAESPEVGAEYVHAVRALFDLMPNVLTADTNGAIHPPLSENGANCVHPSHRSHNVTHTAACPARHRDEEQAHVLATFSWPWNGA